MLSSQLPECLRMTPVAARERKTQADRSADMRARLVDATIASLVENGHARTTAVEVCRRAGVTRGALHHHFADLPDLLAAAMIDTYERHFLSPAPLQPFTSLDAWIERAWERISQPEFKGVIEVWLAARNEPSLASGLRPAIEKYSQVFSIEASVRLKRLIGSSKEVQAFYRLACETMIGLALGRATSPQGKSLEHETVVIEMLKSLARKIVR
jgi:AcrR family transcriptional regulator